MHYLVIGLSILLDIILIGIMAGLVLMALILLCLLGSLLAHRPTPAHREWLRSLASRFCPAEELPDGGGQRPFGYRYAYLEHTDQGVRFRSLTRPTVFGTRAHAQCADKCTSVPALLHQCGFYSVIDAVQLPNKVTSLSGKYCLLRVQLSGKIIEHNEGYRAETQIVHQAWICKQCTAFACKSPAYVLGSNRWSTRLIPLCRHHLQKNRFQSPSFTLGDLRNSLPDIEFGWMD